MSIVTDAAFRTNRKREVQMPLQETKSFLQFNFTSVNMAVGNLSLKSM
jgi:hypothetical protein